MVESATQYRKNGFNDEDAAQLAKITSVFQNVSDEATSASEAASIIISQLIAFGHAGDDATEYAQHFADAVNEVANSFAVSTGDLANGLKVVASSSSAMGNSLEETIGLMVAVTEQTRNASKASRGINTIMANLAAVLDSSSSNGEKIKQIYSDIGLTMEGENGQLKSGYKLLSDLSGEWAGLSSDTQKYIATTIAGTTQLNNFLALMNNFSHATDATNKALNSSGSAMRENERYMGGLEAQTTALKAEFQDLANNVITNELISAVLKLTKALLSLLNNGVGQFITRFGLVSATTLGFTTMVVQLGSKALPLLKAAFVSTGAAAGTAAVGVTALQAALGMVSVIIGVLVASAPYIIDAIKNSNKSIEDLSSELKGLNSELETNKARIEEIQSLSWNERTSEINREYYALLAENEELERNIKLRQDEIKSRADKQKVQVGTSYVVEKSLVTTDIDNLISAIQNSAAEMDVALANSQIDALQRWREALLEGVFDTYEEAYAAIHSFDFGQIDWEMLGYDKDSITSLLRDMEHVIISQNEYKKGIADVIPVLEDYNQLLDRNGEFTSAQNEDYIVLMDSAGELYNGLKQLYDAGVPIGSTNEKFIQQYEQLAKKYDDASAASNNLDVSINRIKAAAPDLYSYMEKSGFTVKSFSDYCTSAKVNALDLAKSLVVAAEGWKTYNDAAAAGFANVMTKTEFNRRSSAKQKYGTYEEYLRAMQSKYQGSFNDRHEAFLDTIKKMSDKTGGNGDDNDDGKKDLTAAQKRLEKFNEALKLLDHQLAMDQISTEEYYASLQKLMDTYLQDAENQETLWKYQEKIYSWKKKAAEDEQSAQEKINSELQKQIELQEKLRDAAEALAKAQQKRILVFRKSGYGYMQDVGAISEAQAAYAKVKSGYAGGTVYSSAGLHMFGENGPELGVIGSGNGVLPSEITRNLWEWGAQRPEEMFASVPAIGGDTISFSGVTMAFPNVRSGNDAQGFMESLVMLARQRAYKRY